MSARYQFLPWVRAGAANAYTNADTLKPVLARRDNQPLTGLPVRLTVNGRTLVDVALRLYGPGDVIGIDPRVVIRTDPPPRSADLEPNYLACIEFDTPDFPWMFTPAAADGQGRLRPWLCLVLVRRGDAVSLSFSHDRPLPMLSAPAGELPDLVESSAWAHAQVVQADETETIERILTAEPQRNLSRLVCPRRLEPHTDYLACLVPTFDLGRRAGLGLEVPAAGEITLAPAWTGTQGQVELPVYHHWEFTTGTGGDFESLADLLQVRQTDGDGPRPLPANDQQASGIGRRPLLANDQPFGLGDAHPQSGALEFQGPLVPADAPDPPAPDEGFRQRLRALLNLSSQPVVTPPVYGSWQAAQPTVPGEGEPPRWLRELNLDPVARAAAGLGARVVQERQEQLVSSAWEQLGDAPALTRLERRLEFGVAVLSSVLRRHVETMNPGRLVQFLGPAHARMRSSAGTLHASLARQNLPPSFSSAPFRRTLRPAVTLARRRSPQAPVMQRIVTHMGSRVPTIGPATGARGFVTPEHLQAQISEIPPDLRRYRAAMVEMLAYVNRFGGEVTFASRPVFQLAATTFKPELVTALDPHQTLRRRFYTRVTSGGDPVAPPAQPGRTVLAQPSFPQPMYQALLDLSPELLLPGIGKIAPNTVTVLQPNPRFIEAYMAGLNHEIASELLWCEFPADLRHTYFRNFWDTGAAAAQQLPEIRTWSPDAPLGGNLTAGQAELVLLIRGELLRRYPEALIYAVPARDPATLGTGQLLPVFRGRIDPDITFLGFALTEAKARSAGPRQPGWFFVIQEQPTAPRFGLDETRDRTEALTSWNNLAWNDTRTVAGAHLKLANLSVPAAQRPAGPTWAFNAAHMAAILRQRPVRVAFHADRLLPPKRPSSPPTS